MNNCTHSNFSPVLQEIIEQGYTSCFVFKESKLFCSLYPLKGYFTSEVHKEPRPCVTSQTIVYVIETKDGIKGHAILNWQEPDDY